MSILPIVTFNDAVLREKTKPLTKDYPNLKKLLADMFETMYNSHGVGLAAPQIGKNIRVITVDSKSMSEDFPDSDLEYFREVFINPIIEEEFGEEFSFREACLSLPRISEEIRRPSKIIMSYFDKDWNIQEKEFSGIQCRILQHEYDHLEGHMWIDKASPLRKKLLQ